MLNFRRFGIFGLIAVVFCFFASCGRDDVEMRTPEDIVGVWSPSSTEYLEFSADNTIHNLQIEYQDGESIGLWNSEVYFYEPGYQLVVYIDHKMNASIYKIVNMSKNAMTWCWVKDIRAEYESGVSIGEILGSIIKEAQEGFKLNPELYQYFVRVPVNDFYSMLERLDIMYPWIY